MASKEKHRLAAIVFTDIVGYTRNMEADADKTLGFLQRQNELIKPCLEKYDGQIVKELGDGLLIMFESAVQAVRCTIEFQNSLKDEEFSVRAGIHIGDIIFKDGDVFGSAVNISARLQSVAKPGGIVVSEDVKTQLKNRKDIELIYKGKKELKGVSGSQNIYEIVTDSTQRVPEGFWGNLFYRRVVQVAAIYAVLIVLVFYGLKWAVQEFVLSPYLVQFGFIALLSLLPSVILVTYYHGKPGLAKWNKVEKIVLPANILGSVIVLFLMFYGKDLGAATEQITYTNEDGEVITREIVKSEFKKSVYFSFFDNKTDNASYDWLQYAFIEIVQLKFNQNINATSMMPYNFAARLKELGYTDGIGTPLTVKEKVASENHLDYIFTGDILNENDSLKVVTELYETNTGQLLSSHTYMGKNVFRISDRINKDLKADLYIPANKGSSMKDLPAEDMLTTSVKAFNHHIIGKNAYVFHNDWKTLLESEKMATEIDPNFALGYAYMINAYISANDLNNMKSAFNKTMELIYKLPERMQFNIRSLYYNLVKVDFDKAQNVVEMWVELYPDDVEAHARLLQMYNMSGFREKMVEELKILIILAPNQYDFHLQLADVYTSLGEYDKALRVYEEYQEKFPNRTDSYQELGDFYFLKGDFDKAIESYEKILLIEPNNINGYINLCYVYINRGDFDKAKEYYTEALDVCDSPQDNVLVFDCIADYYGLRGQIHSQIKALNLKYSEMEEYQMMINVYINRCIEIHHYVSAGDTVVAIDILEELDDIIIPPYNKLTDIAYLNIYIATRDTASIRQTIPKAVEAIETLNFDIFRPLVLRSKAVIAEKNGDYSEAIDLYEQSLEINPTRTHEYVDIGRCYRLDGDPGSAIESIQKRLDRTPFNPKANYEMAMAYLESGNREKAYEYIERAMDVLIEADSNYELKNKVEVVYEELKPVGV